LSKEKLKIAIPSVTRSVLKKKKLMERGKTVRLGIGDLRK